RVHAQPMARRCLSIALGVLGVLMPVQLYVGDPDAGPVGPCGWRRVSRARPAPRLTAAVRQGAGTLP
ncbi:hypothetical protein, partial [Streptomyces sp. NPDC018347]|uniref:hypothetical protein n=1 Tax=Streptomyces sp. NPDC018347 TaxID=3157193 RepID=UPI0033DFE35C